MAQYFMDRDAMVVSEKNWSLALCNIPYSFLVFHTIILGGHRLKMEINYPCGQYEEPRQDTQKNEVTLSTGVNSHLLYGVSVDISRLVGLDEIRSKTGNYREAGKVVQSPDEKIRTAITLLHEEAQTIGSRMNYQAVIGGLGLERNEIPNWLADFNKKCSLYIW